MSAQSNLWAGPAGYRDPIPAGPKAWRDRGEWADFDEAEEQYERQAEKSQPAEEVFFPVPDATSRIEVIGTVIQTKLKWTEFGETLKMLIFCEGDEGRFKLWGTVPRALIEQVSDQTIKDRDATLKGSLVKFTAKISQSSDDPCFGFFNRPSKATVLTFGVNDREP